MSGEMELFITHLKTCEPAIYNTIYRRGYNAGRKENERRLKCSCETCELRDTPDGLEWCDIHRDFPDVEFCSLWKEKHE